LSSRKPLEGRVETVRQGEGNKNFTAAVSGAVSANLSIGDLLVLTWPGAVAAWCAMMPA